MTDSTYFPFSAIVGQAEMKDALLCNAIHPEVGGVLIAGTRGTAKSTAVRSLANLLPSIRAVADCPYNCPPDEPEQQCADCAERDIERRSELVEEIPTPFVNLPIGATEDRVLGTIDLESAIQEGERAFEPGLLARANRGVLYVDEINLLPDHLVDVLLDAVASGTNRVEREGVSVEHPANVLLVGTMNPEEGELRPQLLDRFGLSVHLNGGMESSDRKAVVRRRTAYEADPDAMMAEWSESESALADRIERATALLPDVDIDDELLDTIVEICIEHEVDGLRADIVIHRTARALAAFDGERDVSEAHVGRAAELALGHRSSTTSSREPPGSDPSGNDDDDGESSNENREKPSPETLPDIDRSDEDEDGNVDEDGDWNEDGNGDVRDGDNTDEGPGDEPAQDDGTGYEASPGNRTDDDEDSGNEHDDEDRPAAREGSDDRVFPVTGGIQSPRVETNARLELADASGAGGGTRATTSDRRGSYCRTRRPRGQPTDLAVDATVRAGAPSQPAGQSGNSADLAVDLRPRDLREKVRRSRTKRLVVFVVDSSGSMGTYERMSAVKGAVLSLLEDAYRNRDAVGLVGFRENGAETLLAPTSRVSHAARELVDLPTGGRTPLAAGLDGGLQVVRRERRKAREGTLAPLLVLVTDGRSNHAESSSSPMEAAMASAARIESKGVPAICFDTETGPVRMDFVRELAEVMGAQYVRLDELESGTLSSAVQDVFFEGPGFGV